MSLVNQVLNDLEKRGAYTDIGDATIKVVPFTNSHSMKWLRLVALALIILAAAAWMKWGMEAPSIGAETGSPAAQQSTSPPVVTAPTETQDGNPDTLPQPTELALNPALLLPPVISAVNPNPLAIRQGTQQLTILGNHFARDAEVTLRSPEGRAYPKRNVVSQSETEIILKVNIKNSAGFWSVEVLNPASAQRATSTRHSSGQYKFMVQVAPVAPASPAQKKIALATTVAAQGNTKSVPVGKQLDGISKQPSQINPSQQAENEYRKAYAQMLLGQDSAAINGMENVLQLDPAHLVARQTLVRLLLDGKRNVDAEQVLQQGLQADPRQSSLALLLARIQVSRNEPALALDTLQKSLPYAQKQAEYQAFLGALLQRQVRHKEAIAHFQNAVQLSPQSGVWLMGLGISLRAEERNAEAREAFKRALETNKLSAELHSFVTQQLKEL